MGANVSTSHERFSSVFFWVNETSQFRMKQHLNSMQMRVTTPAAHWPGQQRDILTLKPTCRSYWGVSWFLNDIQWHLWFVMALNSIWWNWWSNIIKASELLKPIKNDVSKPLEKLCIVMYLKNPKLEMMPCIGFCSAFPNYKSKYWTSGVDHQGRLDFIAVRDAGWIVQIMFLHLHPHSLETFYRKNTLVKSTLLWLS